MNCLVLAAMSTAVFAARLAVTALSTGHIVTTGALAAGLAMTASTGHVVAARLAVCAARLAFSTTGRTARLAVSATGLAFSTTGRAARSTACAATTYSGHVGFRVCGFGNGVGGVHLYIMSCENITRSVLEFMKIDARLRFFTQPPNYHTRNETSFL